MPRPRSFRRLLFLACDDATRLYSEAMERRLTRAERAALRLHEVICLGCRRFRRQIGWLRRLMARLSADLPPDVCSGPGLTPEAKERIKRALKG